MKIFIILIILLNLSALTCAAEEYHFAFWQNVIAHKCHCEARSAEAIFFSEIACLAARPLASLISFARNDVTLNLPKPQRTNILDTINEIRFSVVETSTCL